MSYETLFLDRCIHVADILEQSIHAYNSGMICEKKRDKIIEKALSKRRERDDIVSAFRKVDESNKSNMLYKCCSVMWSVYPIGRVGPGILSFCIDKSYQYGKISR